MPMKNKQMPQQGLTLIELVIAVTILAIVAGPVLLLTTQMATNTRIASDITVATYTAQLQMESLKGLSRAELTAANAAPVQTKNDFQVDEIVKPIPVSATDSTPSDLVNVTIRVWTKNETNPRPDNVLYTVTGVLHVTT